MPDHLSFMREAVRLAQDNRAQGAHPFGAVLTQDGERVAIGVNEVKQNCDPTSHAEIQALRAAGAQLKQQRLDGCVVYASGYPCPMCLSAMVACGVKAIYYAFDNAEAAPFGMSSDPTYAALGMEPKPTPLPLIRIDTGVTAAQLYGDASTNAG